LRESIRKAAAIDLALGLSYPDLVALASTAATIEKESPKVLQLFVAAGHTSLPLDLLNAAALREYPQTRQREESARPCATWILSDNTTNPIPQTVVDHFKSTLVSDVTRHFEAFRGK
jgi:hypothetical protein